MSLSVELDFDLRRLCVPGDRISGKVVLRLAKAEEVNGIIVIFRGKAKTSIGRVDYKYEHRQVLFECRKELFKGPFTLPGPQTHEWPFEFTFPELFNQKVAGLEDNGRGPFSMYFPQRLPPSITSEGYDGEDKITYKVIAKIPKTFVDTKSKVLIRFVPFRHVSQPDPKSAIKENRFLSHKFRIDDDGQPRALSNREYLKAKLHSSDRNRTLDFNAEVEFPTVIVIGSKVPLMLTLRTSLPEPHPVFTTKSFRVCIQGTSHIRAPGPLEERIGAITNDIDFHSTKTYALISFSPNERTAVGQITMGPDWGLAPTFASFSIARTYTAKVHLKVVCLEKEFDLDVEFLGVVMLSPELDPLEGNSRDGSARALEVQAAMAPPGYAEGSSSGLVPPEYDQSRKAEVKDEKGWSS